MVRLVTLLALLTSTAHAAEGMWPFNMAPIEQVKAEHGFELTPAFLDRAMKASVRFNNGGSGSFVSPNGLVMTNHHVGADCIQKLSQGETDAMKDGFLASAATPPVACPDLELNQLLEITDVTEAVEAAAKGAADDAAKNTARKAEMAKLEKACTDASQRRCDVVTLYAGGAYHLYQYKKYTDVRLVFAPEFQAAFFGGDQDNFTYPRMCLDAALFRVYEDGKPVATPAFFPLSEAGAKDGSLIFVSGNPGSTGRFDVPAKLTYLRDVAYKIALEDLHPKVAAIEAYMKTSPAAERAARDDYFGLQNAIKALTGYLGGLNDPALIAEVERRHAEVQAKVAGDARLTAAWPKLSEAYAKYRTFYPQYAATESWLAPQGQVVWTAKTLLRLTAELEKPSGERLREYRDSALESLELRLLSPAPIDDGLEVVQIAFGLNTMARVLGADHPAVKAALGGLSAQARAEAVVKGTQIKDVEARKALLKGGRAAVDAAKDPAIELVRAWDAAGRALRKRHEDEVESVEREYAGRIAEAWAKAHGKSVYPDATFTLRLNHGVVKGFEEAGKAVPYTTTFGDLFAKYDAAKGAMPYALPKRWLDARAKLDPKQPYNFVSTNDIIGGNSGSPIFDQRGVAVGLVFDGNIHQLPNRFLFREDKERSVSVHTSAILHALDKVYGATALLAELKGQ